MSNQEEVTYSPEQIKKTITMVWLGQVVGFVAIVVAGYFYFPLIEMHKRFPEYNYYFLLGGLLSGMATFFYRKHFNEVLRSNRNLPGDEFWALVKEKMQPGIGLAELPFFVGIPAYMLSGSQQTYLILGAYSIALLFMAKPPTTKP